MTYYHFEIDGQTIAVTRKDIDLIITTYHSANSFFVTEETTQGGRIVYPLASSIHFDDIITEITGNPRVELALGDGTMHVDVSRLVERLLKSSMYGTILNCHSFDIDLHCGVKNGTLYVQQVQSTSTTTKLEGLFHTDMELGRFIVEHCDKTNEKYIETINHLDDIHNL